MKILIKWLILTISIIISAYLIADVTVAGFWTALWLAIFLGIVNILLKPILMILTFPINIVTLGLFTFVINATLVLLASTVIKGFEVNGFWAALLFGVVLSIISFVLNTVFGIKR